MEIMVMIIKIYNSYYNNDSNNNDNYIYEHINNINSVDQEL